MIQDSGFRNRVVFAAGAFFCFGAFIAGIGSAAAAEELAQATQVRRAVDAAKESVSALVTARDENVPNDFALRVETFKKATDLSASEARDLRVRLLLVETRDPYLLQWKESSLNVLAEAIDYFERAKNTRLYAVRDTEQIKKLAQEFKDWRDARYVPIAGPVGDFLSVQKSKEITAVATERVSRIEKDLAKLERNTSKSANAVRALFKKASGLVAAGVQATNDADRLFYETYLLPLQPTSSAPQGMTFFSLLPVATSTAADAVGTSTEPLAVPLFDSTTSTAPQQVLFRGAAETSVPPPQSIKDLMRDAFTDVKDAYQIFIEMSGLVRKLL